MSRRPLPFRALRFLLPFAGALASASCRHAEVQPNPSPAMHTAEPLWIASTAATTRLLPERIAVTGELRADAAIELCAETEGRVLRAGCERGQVVPLGALLVELDGREPASRLAEAEAVQAQITARLGPALGDSFDPEQAPEVRLARVNLERAAKEAGRYARLVADGAVARSLHDVERANHEVARERHAAEIDRVEELYGSLLAQRARVALARKAVDDTRVLAPWAGAVLARHVDVGQWVKKGDRLLSLVKTDVLRVELAVPECHAGAVRPGQAVQLESRASTGTFAGTIAHVGPGLDAGSRSRTVEVVVDNADGRLQAGSFVTATIELPGSLPSVVVDRAAVVAHESGNHVFVVAGDRVQKRFVQLGRDVGDVVEVRRGLAAGEQVVVQGVDRLIDGARVAADAAGE